MQATPFLSMFAVAAIVLAGCSGASASEAKAGVGTTAPAATVSADTGSITGSIVDDEMVAVARADVAVQGATEATAQSDAEGRFTFNGLAPGPYVLFAQRLGYESGSKRVDVVAGEAATVTISVKPLLVSDEARVETTTYAGFIDGDVYTAGIGVYSPRSFPINVTKGATEVVSSATWEATVPLFARYLRLGLTLGDARNQTSGRSPITVNVPELEVNKAKEKVTASYGVAFGCPANPMCFVNNPDALVPQISYQQKVNFYNAVFYNQNAPPGYTGLPE